MRRAQGAATSADPFEDLGAIRSRLAGGPALVALDFDGTLTEIVDDPAAPGITVKRRSLLAAIPAPDRRLAIVSGRKLEDVRRRVGVTGVIYVGNHGLEIEGPDVERRPAPEVAEGLARLLGSVGRLLDDFPIETGIEIEDKTWTATLHVRPRGDTKRHAEVAEAIGAAIDEAGFVLHPGKASWEIRPAGAFDKGDALRWLIDAVPGGSAARSLYVGDDLTDEDAFRALPEGITVRVGDPDQDTAARYRLVDPAAVYRLLEEIFA